MSGSQLAEAARPRALSSGSEDWRRYAPTYRMANERRKGAEAIAYAEFALNKLADVQQEVVAVEGDEWARESRARHSGSNDFRLQLAEWRAAIFVRIVADDAYVRGFRKR